jgi:hypothetical protein
MPIAYDTIQNKLKQKQKEKNKTNAKGLLIN